MPISEKNHKGTLRDGWPGLPRVPRAQMDKPPLLARELPPPNFVGMHTVAASLKHANQKAKHFGL